MGSCLKVRVVVVRDSIFDSPNHFVDSGATSARMSDESRADLREIESKAWPGFGKEPCCSMIALWKEHSYSYWKVLSVHV